MQGLTATILGLNTRERFLNGRPCARTLRAGRSWPRQRCLHGVCGDNRPPSEGHNRLALKGKGKGKGQKGRGQMSSPGFVDSRPFGRSWGHTMPKSRRPYPVEYRERIVELVRAGRSVSELAREFEPTAQCIRNWIRQADRDDGRRSDGLTTDDRTELQRLKRENATLREEREILKKAAAWFARETGSIPPGSSNS